MICFAKTKTVKPVVRPALSIYPFLSINLMLSFDIEHIGFECRKVYEQLTVLGEKIIQGNDESTYVQ